MEGPEGTPNGLVRVQIDEDNPAIWITLDMAQTVLQLWRKRNPAQMGAYLGEAFTGTAPTVTRAKG